MAAIDVTLKGDALLIYFSVCSKRENLVTTAIGQHWFFPIHELVKSAGLLKLFHSWSQVQMIRVAQNDLCFYFLDQLLVRNCFHAAGSSHGHEDWSQNLAVIYRDCACARL